MHREATGQEEKCWKRGIKLGSNCEIFLGIVMAVCFLAYNVIYGMFA